LFGAFQIAIASNTVIKLEDAERSIIPKQPVPKAGWLMNAASSEVVAVDAIGPGDMNHRRPLSTVCGWCGLYSLFFFSLPKRRKKERDSGGAENPI